MKKFLAFASVLLAGLVASAYPAINDKATFNGLYIPKGSTQGVQFMQTMEIKSFNASTQKYLVVRTLDLPDGRSQEEQAETAASDLMTQSSVNQILANCAAVGGVSEQIKVTAGTFNTCKITQTNSTIWLGDVPFGIVKMISLDSGSGATIALELSLFQAGQ